PRARAVGRSLVEDPWREKRTIALGTRQARHAPTARVAELHRLEQRRWPGDIRDLHVLQVDPRVSRGRGEALPSRAAERRRVEARQGLVKDQFDLLVPRHTIPASARNARLTPEETRVLSHYNIFALSA